MIAEKDGKTGKAVLEMKYNKADKGPEFSHSAYTGVYKQDDKNNVVVTLDEKIVVTPNDNNVKVTLVKAGTYKLLNTFSFLFCKFRSRIYRFTIFSLLLWILISNNFQVKYLKHLLL